MQEILSNNTHRKTILITGATSGIGKALSKIYLKNDWTVIGIGRDKTKIEEFSLDFPNNFYFYQADLNNFEKTNIIFDEIFSKFKNINSFILNAGIYIPDDFQNFKFINAQETFNVNVLSIYIILEKIKSFFERKISSRNFSGFDSPIISLISLSALIIPSSANSIVSSF